MNPQKISRYTCVWRRSCWLGGNCTIMPLMALLLLSITKNNRKYAWWTIWKIGFPLLLYRDSCLLPPWDNGLSLPRPAFAFKTLLALLFFYPAPYIKNRPTASWLRFWFLSPSKHFLLFHSSFLLHILETDLAIAPWLRSWIIKTWLQFPMLLSWWQMMI